MNVGGTSFLARHRETLALFPEFEEVDYEAGAINYEAGATPTPADIAAEYRARGATNAPNAPLMTTSTASAGPPYCPPPNVLIGGGEFPYQCLPPSAPAPTPAPPIQAPPPGRTTMVRLTPGLGAAPPLFTPTASPAPPMTSGGGGGGSNDTTMLVVAGGAVLAFLFFGRKKKRRR